MEKEEAEKEKKGRTRKMRGLKNGRRITIFLSFYFRLSFVCCQDSMLTRGRERESGRTLFPFSLSSFFVVVLPFRESISFASLYSLLQREFNEISSPTQKFTLVVCGYTRTGKTNKRDGEF